MVKLKTYYKRLQKLQNTGGGSIFWIFHPVVLVLLAQILIVIATIAMLCYMHRMHHCLEILMVRQVMVEALLRRA